MQSRPAKDRPGWSMCENLPKLSTAYHLSCGTVTRQFVHGKHPDCCLDCAIAEVGTGTVLPQPRKAARARGLLLLSKTQ